MDIKFVYKLRLFFAVFLITVFGVRVMRNAGAFNIDNQNLFQIQYKNLLSQMRVYFALNLIEYILTCFLHIQLLRNFKMYHNERGFSRFNVVGVLSIWVFNIPVQIFGFFTINGSKSKYLMENRQEVRKL